MRSRRPPWQGQRPGSRLAHGRAFKRVLHTSTREHRARYSRQKMADSILPKMPEPGAVVGGKYEIIGVVGKGGMGVVFEALHRKIGRRVALKMLRPHVRDDPETIARFEREARAAGQLRSVNIARVMDVETQGTE